MPVALGFVTANARMPEEYAPTRLTNVARVPHQRVRRTGVRPSAEPEPREPLARRPFVAVLVVVALEVAALAASALAVLISLAIGRHARSEVDAWLLVVLAALGAVLLGYVWQGLRRLRRWSRAPVVLVELLALPVGFSLISDGVWWAGMPLIVCAIVGLIGILAPSTTHLLIDR
jgi:hypothetical protein